MGGPALFVPWTRIKIIFYCINELPTTIIRLRNCIFACIFGARKLCRGVPYPSGNNFCLCIYSSANERRADYQAQFKHRKCF